jgi:hypothetical protein
LRINGTQLQGAAVTFTESGFVAIDGGGFDRIVPVTVIPDSRSRRPDYRAGQRPARPDDRDDDPDRGRSQ